MAGKYYVIGNRLNGSKVVLKDCKGDGNAANHWRKLFSEHLEGYSSITVERVHTRHYQKSQCYYRDRR